MTKTHFVKRITQPDYGELYQFYEVDKATREETPVDPFDAGLLLMAVEEELPEILTITSKRGADASGYYMGEKFIVLKGSKFAVSTTAKCPKNYVRLREKLVLEGLLIPLHNQLFLLEDYVFDNAVIAMGTVVGGWGKGPHGWKAESVR
ncbi:methionine sulfoxide reductase [Planococcus sp. CAU13]|uniref:methionine sulfoxide reductase n=1 Tax=Planococcus sp. CAU13 TaxID=1541197 RepID=UPI00052FEA70|nr:methionine sulfoxide reductase [Planococcus sp. CAU13]